MKELKTLNDLGKRYHSIKYRSITCVDIKKLKEEAIKWITSTKPFKKLDVETWMEFFNLTEQEIKNGIS